MEQPDTIDMSEFLLNMAIKWQNHARLSYALIEIMRDDPVNFDNDDIIATQDVLRVESEVARTRLFAYIETSKEEWEVIDGPAWDLMRDPNLVYVDGRSPVNRGSREHAEIDATHRMRSDGTYFNHR